MDKQVKLKVENVQLQQKLHGKRVKTNNLLKKNKELRTKLDKLAEAVRKFKSNLVYKTGRATTTTGNLNNLIAALEDFEGKDTQ
jgi:wobble nucleotide-excising tRNase